MIVFKMAFPAVVVLLTLSISSPGQTFVETPGAAVAPGAVQSQGQAPAQSPAESSVIVVKPGLTDEQLAQIAEQVAALIPENTPTVSPWLNAAEAGERLRCGKDRIYDLIALGKLHPHRDGRRVLLHRDDLDAYVEERVA